MERLLTDICSESTKIQDIQSKCTELLDHLATDDGKQDWCNSDNLQQILQIFRLCAKSDIGKLNALSIDLVRVYIRKVNETGNDTAKEETITIILKCSRDMLTETSVATTLELLAIIVELAATFSAYLTTNHVIEIIEMCHAQIKQYVMANSKVSSSLPSRANTLLNVASNHFAFTPRVSIEDKVLSAIYLTAGQVCHHYTKHRIIGGLTNHSTTTTTTSSVSSFTECTSNKVSQDFVYLLLYLSKKLECKLSFYRDMKQTSERESGASAVGSEDPAKGEIFVLIKIYNCFYLKCLQYTLLTIPDAWKYMTTHLMEIVCKHLVPILVDILTPLSTILVNNSSSQASPKSSQILDLTNFGRGTEKVHFGSGISTNKDFLYNTLNYQERQYIYKISLELLRLFGLENSMRPLLEALFHRILLLPPLDQRLDSLIYMQEILKNPLLVLILMSNPLCLFGASSSHSQNLDLFKIFLDAIKESSQAEDALLVQLSSLCLATLFGTLDTLASRNALQEEAEGASSPSGEQSSIWKSPTVKMILSFASSHRALYEQMANSATGHGAKSSSYCAQLSKYHSLVSRYNILNLKNRICGYDSKSYEKQYTMPAPIRQQQSGSRTSGEQTIGELRRQYLREDFNYQDRLNALINSQMSSTESAEDSRTVELEARIHSASKRKPMHRQHSTLTDKRTYSLHLSLEDLSKCTVDQNWVTTATLKYTASDTRLFVKDPILVMNQAVERELSYDSGSSVFEPHLSSDSSISESKTPEDDEDEYTEDQMGGFNSNNARVLMFGGHLELDGDANLRHFERALSHIFIRKLRLLLPELVTCRNLVLVDDCIQTFSSNYCKDLFRNLKQLNRSRGHQGDIEANVCVPSLGDLTQSEIDILTKYSHLVDSLFINADGIYLATYSALLLTMKLLYLDYYQSSDKKVVPMSETDFIDDIFNYHTTIYLSPHFLAEIYQSLLAENFFAFLMPDSDLSDKTQFENVPLIKLLHDIDVLDSSKPNAYKLSDYVRLEQMARTNSRCSVASTSQDKSRPVAIIIKRLLAYFWDTFLGCLRVDMNAKFTYSNVVNMLEQVNSSYIASLCTVLQCANKQTLGQLKSNTAYIQMMQMLLNTSVQVGAYARLDSLYSLFYEHICKFAYQEKPSHLLSDIKVNLSLRKSNTTPDLSSSAERVHLVLSPGQIASIKTLLNRSSQVASHCPRVWRHVFDLCKFVTDLENMMFRSCHSSLLSRARISIGTILRSNSISTQMSSASSSDSSDHYQNLYNFNSFNHLPGINEVENFNAEANFDSLIAEIKSKNCDLELKSKELEQVVEYLSWFVGQIFENVALKFNLSLLSNFVKELCDYSSDQLVAIKHNIEANPATQNGLEQSPSEFKSLMLARLVEVILRFVRNGRPLLHFMKIWPIAASHLVDASTHRELSISKKAITSMHDIINAVLSAYSEPDFFNFNESLFKSYERLLLFELCNSDCQQELLLNSICEFVEGASSEIRSGWRSIFKALRGLRLAIRENLATVNCSHHVQILVDTFEAFLHTDNMHVFAYASVDFILCIFHLIRSVSTVPSDSTNSNSSNNLEETFIVFLKYVQRFCKLIRTIHSVPEDSFVIAPYIRAKKARLIELDRLAESFAKSSPAFQANLVLTEFPELGGNNRQTALLQLWSLVFDEYATTIYASHLQYRPMLLEVYFPLLQTASELNGSLHFVLYCCNHTVLPLIQNLFAETLTVGDGIDELYMFLKSWLEIFNSHIIKFILAHYDRVSRQSDHYHDSDRWRPVGLLLKQSLLVYIECLNGQYHDLISILSLSLLRHLLLSLNRILNSYLWDIVIECFRVGHQITLAPLKQLMFAFASLPVNSDLARIKIMTTRTDRSSEYTRKRARQIFFIEGKSRMPMMGTKSEFKSMFGDLDNRDFNIIVETASGVNQSLSYNLLISQLHNHLVLLQIISSVLTFNLKPTLSNLMYFMHENFADMSTTAVDQSLNSMRPVLQLTLTQYRDLCSSLKQSFRVAMEFDSRPGLKFLMQHICQTNISANLYQMSALVWCVQFVVNFALCCSEQHRNEECLAVLEDLFGEISTLYGQKVQFVSNQNSRNTGCTNGHETIDDSVVGAGHNSGLGCFSRSSLPFILQPLNSDDSLTMESAFTAAKQQQQQQEMGKCNPFDEEGSSKVYHLVSSQSVSQYLSDYRKVKQKQSAHWHHRGSEPHLSFRVSSSVDSGLSNSTAVNSNITSTTAADLGLDPETRKFLQLDSTLCVRIWSDILANCIDLHVRSARDSFCFMLPPFRLLARSLVLYCSEEQLRHSLSNWIDHLAMMLTNNSK